jgi:hypothetical protein
MEARPGEGVLALHLATERARGRDAHGSFSARLFRVAHRRQESEIEMLRRAGMSTVSAELLLARMRAKLDNLCNRRAKLRAIARGNDARKAIDCAVPHAPPVHMIELLQQREVTLVGYPEEYDKSLER